jgi:hypothetical protein
MKPELIPVILGFATFLGTLTVVIVGFLFNNSRITDLKELFHAEIGTVRGEIGTVRGEIGTVRAEAKAVEASILSQMATYQMDIISKIAELDNRISRLER